MARPSLRKFVYRLKKRVNIVAQGRGFASRAILLAWAFFDSIPGPLLRIFPFLNPPLQKIKERLAEKTIIEVNGCLFHCIDSESIYILQPEFEDWMWKYLKIPKGGVFIDVGAHIGKYTIQVAKILGGSGLVIAIEPHPGNYKHLVENIKLNDLRNVIALNVAAWSEECELKLFVGDMHGHHSLMKNFGRGFFVVHAKPLDKVLEELGISRVDFVKIDVEGAELEVLKGMSITLKKFKPIVVVEIRDMYLRRIEEFLNQLEYTIEKVAPMYYLLKPAR
jgi:FkbM family methyltransferase